MVTFYQVSDSGEMKKVDFSDLSNFALKDECHLDGLSKDTLNFDELLDKGIYTYSDFDGTEKEDGNWPSALTSGYVVVMVEDDSRAQRGITQMVLDDNNGSYYRRGVLSETENVFEDWHSLSANNNSVTNLSLGKGSPSAIDGIWTEVSNLSYNIQLWKQINGISTMSTTSETNVILNGIETLALTGAQTIYVRDSTGAFSKLCLDISNGGTGANTAAGALSALGAASAADLQSVQDSLSGKIPFYSNVANFSILEQYPSCIFITGEKPSDSPDFFGGSYFYGIHLKMNNNYITDITTNIGGRYLAIRGKDNGIWNKWQLIAIDTTIS